VVLHVEEDPRFTRSGPDIYTKISITFPQATLGDKIEIQGLNSKLHLDIPPGTQPSSQFVIRGAGLPSLHSSARGDFYVEVQVKIPEKLSEKQKELIREFEKTLQEPPEEETLPKEESASLFGSWFKKKK
jgi:molecular chaperone DnaJ